MSGVSSWGGLLWGTVLSSEWASMALPGLSAAVGLIVFSLPGSPSLGLVETPQVGYLVIISIFPAHSGWVGSQAHLVNWFQGTGIRQKVNAQQVRLLLCSPSSQLSPPKTTELPRVFQPSSSIFSTSQQDKKDRACQNQGSVFNSSMSFQTSKKSHRTAVKTGGAWLLRDNCRERRWFLHFFLGSPEVPGTWLVYTLWVRQPQPWCPDQEDVWPQVGGLGAVWVPPHLHGSGSRVRGDPTHTKLRKRDEYMWVSFVFRN